MLALSSDLTQGCWLEHGYVILSEIFPLPPDVITDSKRECPRGPAGNSFIFYSLCSETESLLPWSLTCPHLRRRGHVPPWWEEWAQQVTLQERRWWEGSLWLGWRVLSVAVNPLAITIEIPPLSKIYLFRPLPLSLILRWHLLEVWDLIMGVRCKWSFLNVFPRAHLPELHSSQFEDLWLKG